MRYLNKIVLINSAHVPYAEVALDGNVHFIGTQGVGKSTILRAILFFYTADKGNLGIGNGQRPFDDFYLPNPDSYIVYEITRETGKFFVLVSKRQGRAAYNIVDCAYDKRYLIDEEGKVRHEWGKISLEIGSKVFKSQIIRTYQEFRDIIYGNKTNVAKDLQRFNIMESPKYQNVPRTIQNIFLNQSLESKEIKQTIISSMDFTTEPVKLPFFRNQITAFRKMYEDTLKWYRKESNGRIKVEDDAAKVEQKQTNLTQTNKHIEELAACLAYAKRRDTTLLPDLQQQEKEATEALTQKNIQLTEGNKEYTKERDGIVGTIRLLENDLKTTKEKREYWDKSNIKELAELVARKEELEIEAKSKKKEYGALASNNTDINDKYTRLIDQERLKLKELTAQLTQQALDTEKENLEKKGKAKDRTSNEKQQQQASYRTEDEEISQQLDEVKDQLNALAMQRMKVEQTDPFSEKKQTAEAKKKSLSEKRHKLELTKTEKTMEEQRLNSETEAMCKACEAKHEKAKESLDAEQKRKEEDLRALNSLLERQEGSLINWLSENVEGWENTLGKVLDEDTVLYNTNLSPQIEATSAGDLMGVSIDYTQVNKTIRTPQELLEEKKEKEKEIDSIREQKRKEDEQFDAEIENIRKKNVGLLRSMQTEKNCADTELRALPRQTEQLEQELEALNAQTQAWRREELMKTETENAIALTKKTKLQQKRSEKNKLLEEKLAALDNTLQKELNALESEKQTELNRLRQQVRTHQNNFEAQRLQLTEQMHNELQGKGVDKNRLQELQNKIESTEKLLKHIERHQEEYYAWKRDTEQYFEQEAERQSKLATERQQLHNIEARFAEKEAELKKTIAQLSQTRRQAEERAKQIQEGLNELAGWQTANPNELPKQDCTKEEKTEETITALLNQMRDHTQARMKNMNEFRQSVNTFLSNFSENNTFNFKMNPSTDDDYTNFATSLHEFVTMRKMDEYCKRTSEIYVGIMQHAARHMGDVMKDNTQVQKIISRINNDFAENNFAGVIKDIQLRTEPSNDRLTRLFLNIYEFATDAAYNLGELNLFADEKQRAANNQKALQLVDALAQQLDAEPKREEITLANTFKLEFKVKENDNDTSWVEKLSSVGSDGTDILVKAMVNIMLINVFKSKESKRFGDFKLHCMMDEIGKLHPNNVKGILDFANKRNIFLINSSPTTYNASAYRYTYTLSKDSKSDTVIKTLLTIK